MRPLTNDELIQISAWCDEHDNPLSRAYEYARQVFRELCSDELYRMLRDSPRAKRTDLNLCVAGADTMCDYIGRLILAVIHDERA